jgi:hypothetical protein
MIIHFAPLTYRTACPIHVRREGIESLSASVSGLRGTLFPGNLPRTHTAGYGQEGKWKAISKFGRFGMEWGMTLQKFHEDHSQAQARCPVDTRCQRSSIVL